ncbi:MAG TPA: Maf family nucleotide pyrophosphatase [Methylocella sp.]|nr:Maf family nucleotide pyrophosphatase [Methylocella sp.]
MTDLWRAQVSLVLASKSSARHKLLAGAGLPFETLAASIDERAMEAPLLASGASAVALQLSRAKALQVATKRPGQIVIGADQTLCLEGRVLGKPANRAAAVMQLKAMSGHTHELHSGCCAARGDAVLFETVEIARLTCRRFSAEFIETYVAQAGDSVLSSAGAYQLEGLGIHLFEAIEGDHATILGLPLLPLLKFLREEGSLLS